ncbi:MAG: hypothetical protein H6841_08980 [Planctomycetes bacterium]|nr:hypothetical protein [Planctomycetota bacterium]MCB9936112.1 hypothetical protein [Planctomycetota bacterium]
MRSLESRIFKSLALLAVVGLVIAGTIGGVIGGPEGALAGVLLTVLAFMPLAILAGTVLAVTHHVLQRRELRANLASPAACRTMSKPCPAAVVSAAVLFIFSAPLLMAATVLAERANSDVRSWLPFAAPLFVALVCQWVGTQRLGDYLLARQAWREIHPPASPQK